MACLHSLITTVEIEEGAWIYNMLGYLFQPPLRTRTLLMPPGHLDIKSISDPHS
jgi:hypothetical protein